MLKSELLPVHRTNFESIDLVRLENYIKDILRNPDIPQTTETWISRLLGLGFLTKQADNIYCTIAGLILFGKSLRSYLKQTGLRNYRNPVIMEVLRDYGYVDFRGMGIRTKVVPLMKKFNDSKPLFEATKDYLKTTFYR